MSYLDIDTEYSSDDISLLRKEVHRFAKEELRPASIEIDQLSREEYLKLPEKNSKYWDIMGKMKELGFHRALLPEQFGGDELSPQERHVLMEELAWGSPGLAVALGVDILPVLLAGITFDDDLRTEYVEPYLEDTEPRFQGCWGVTEPQHGSELLMMERLLENGENTDIDKISEPQATAEKDDNGWVINGVKSSWVTAAPLATHCALHVNMSPKEGSPGYLCIVPLDADGVKKGDPIDKLGQRDAPQGDIAFNDVWIPDSHMVLTPDMMDPETGLFSMKQILCGTSSHMATVSTGLARAAFEEALKYSRNRYQGGKPICEHQAVKSKLYNMFEKVETMRAYSRKVAEHVDGDDEMFSEASYRHALAAQVYCKRMAFQVAHNAVQIHGANGITKDYVVEKMFRDARVKLIEDGTLDVLSQESAEGVIKNYEVD